MIDAFKSSIKKLSKFFVESRDKWKERAKEANNEIRMNIEVLVNWGDKILTLDQGKEKINKQFDFEKVIEKLRGCLQRFKIITDRSNILKNS